MSTKIIQHQNEEIEQTRQSLQDERENHKKALVDEKQQVMNEIKMERDNLAAEKSEIQFQHAQLEADRKTLESEKAELEEDKKIFEQKAAMGKDAPEFIHTQLMQLQTENSDLQRQLEDTSNVLEELNNAKTHIVELENEMGQMVPAEIASIDPKELDDLRQKSNTLADENQKIREIMSLQKDAIAAYGVELSNANEAVAKAEKMLEQEQAKLANKDEDNSELENLKSRIRELLNENSSVKSDLAKARSESEVFHDQNEDLKHQIVQLRNTVTESNELKKPRYTLQDIQEELATAGIDADVKPGNGHTFLVGMKLGCSVNVNFDDDFVYIEKKCRNARKLVNTIGDWNQTSGITFNYWCDSEKVMCRIDYTLRPSTDPNETLSKMIESVCENFGIAK